MIDEPHGAARVAFLATTAATQRAAKKAGRPSALPKATLFALLVAGLAAATAPGPREALVRVAPQFASLYAAIGLPVNLVGLEIRDLHSTVERNTGGAMLAIEGTIANIRSETVKVPPVRIGVDAADGHEIYTWTTAAPKPQLAEGETIDFRARLNEPPAEANKVTVSFAAVQ
ncbi:MAG TPA: FxLYD domain-containing protein [Beijerinckiaceae bacterium]|nr:FxLYD domain-containing protein [Beijerinckiaceae bacterium]